MWKRFRSSRSASSNDVLSQTSSAPTYVDERSTSAPVEPPPASDRPQEHLFPDRTLRVDTDAPAPARRGSALSDIHAQLYSPHRRQRSQDRREDPFGLVVLHSPPERTIDVIFIHGLGGTSLRTWCRDRDVDNLWPKLWLPVELPTARILTFGYNTHFSSKKEQASYTIGDFANDLLFRMKYGESTAERLGQVPIVIVAHSMGGLVFKKAFVQGHLSDEFSEIVSMIKAVLFLATPHRGTDLAETLNKLLSTSVFGHSPKEYVTQLARKSPTIDELNDSFRHHASKLQIFSFYETLATTTGPVSLMVVDKPTAVMGYPNETPTPLTANHHNVCKFTGPNDPNYISVVGALRSIADSLLTPVDDVASKEDLRHLASLLGVTGPPEEDLSFGTSARKQGTCEGFLASDEVINWRNSKSRRVLWTHAQPGGGKSTLCSFVIERLLEDGHYCSYFFFKHGQRAKQSTSNMVRSLAYQTALQLPEFRKALVGLAVSGVKLSSADSSTVWDKLFTSIFASIKTERNIFWAFDGLDEAESSKRVIELISRVADFKTPIRVLVFSRPLASINQAFQLAKKKMQIIDMPLPDNRSDIRLMVTQEIDYLMSGDDFKAAAVDEIVSRAQGNFLWASLVIQRVVNCHREEQVKQVLESTPDGMQELYDRMADAIFDLELDEDKALAKVLLTWAMYSKSPITVEELREIYPQELSSIMDLNHAVSQVCGQFVAVNPQGRVTLVHHSARQYLKKTKRRLFTLDAESRNEELFIKCLTTLCDKGLRRKLQMLKIPRFLLYASTSWALHLESSSPESDNVLDALVRFFGGPYPLAWVQYLAMSGHLSELFGASRRLTAWRQSLAAIFPSHQPLIYQCIPALSPTSSIVYQKFNGNPASTLSVSGISNEEWDDCLARVSGGSGRALRFAASPLYLAVVSDWSPQVSTENPRQERAIDLRFDEQDALMMISEQRRVYTLRTRQTETSPMWEQLDPTLLDEPGVPEGTFLSTPSCVAFNNDCTQIAVAYRSFPLSIWTVDPPQMVARLRKKSRHGHGSANSYTGDNKVVWHPSGTEVIGIYGQIFKWSPEDDSYDEVKDEAGLAPHGLACSPDGQVFVTMDVGGSIKIFDVASMSLIYKLSSEDRINQITFSPDNLRFYDLRGSYCNVWEPNCLLRLGDSAAEQLSDTDSAMLSDDFWSDTGDTLSTSISFPASESHAESKPAITAVEPGQLASRGLLIAHANEDGSINIYDTVGKKKKEIAKTMFKMRVEHLAWSPKQDHLAYSLTNGATTVRSVRIDYTGERTVVTEPVYIEKRSSAEQMSGPQHTRGEVLADCQLPDNDEPTKWQQHPSELDSLICVSASSASIFSWDNLEKRASIPFELPQSSAIPDTDNNPPTATLHTILDSHSLRYLLLRTTTMHHNRPIYNFTVLPTQSIYSHTTSPTPGDQPTSTPPSNPTTIQPLPLPPSLTRTLSHALGILPDSRLVFIDRQLWVCTTTLSPSGGRRRRRPAPLLPAPRLGHGRRPAHVPRLAGRDGAVPV
ncbi:hypothetical protein CHGG_02329 [Chaetomium globosum CBS 148.51]|uniref:GPI inositol-deacylase n=1 Tax=Chaetomium globosum (strain ATCC 6205 / CBS 148.51 / DSM 1962 / NBRC 6347 / NRRL 1970) TaxID=306901 RepID=Q2HBS5_CHAGB|nr:uncharacterized protein CHGG_02329 [Chaetomium globosum CBS 148.51]EAQ90394.1 hypothetical protein CHGG_02329 [Chaetomium globosum CBS 148.51]